MLWEKVAQMPLLTLIFLGLGWPWVGEFDGFILIFTCFPTQHNLVNRKHPVLSVVKKFGFCAISVEIKRFRILSVFEKRNFCTRRENQRLHPLCSREKQPFDSPLSRKISFCTLSLHCGENRRLHSLCCRQNQLGNQSKGACFLACYTISGTWYTVSVQRNCPHNIILWTL